MSCHPKQAQVQSNEVSTRWKRFQIPMGSNRSGKNHWRSASPKDSEKFQKAPPRRRARWQSPRKPDRVREVCKVQGEAQLQEVERTTANANEAWQRRGEAMEVQTCSRSAELKCWCKVARGRQWRPLRSQAKQGTMGHPCYSRNLPRVYIYIIRLYKVIWNMCHMIWLYCYTICR